MSSLAESHSLSSEEFVVVSLEPSNFLGLGEFDKEH